MRNTRLLQVAVVMLLAAACTAAPAGTPQVILVTQEVLVTQQVVLPSSTPSIVTATALPTAPPSPTALPPTPTPLRSHEWTDFGGICMRPDNLPAGTQVNPDAAQVEKSRTLLLQSLWRVIDLSYNAGKLTPSFGSVESFVSATSKDVYLRGPFLPIGKLPPLSDTRSFTLQDPVSLWGKINPGVKFKGLSMKPICLEFFPPLEFEAQKRVHPEIQYVSLVGEVVYAKFDLEDILGAPRLSIKLYQNPYPGKKAYQELLGFAPSNTTEQNALAANQHFGALIATFNSVLWGSFDGDGTQEFGYGPKNSDPLPIADFQPVDLFVPTP